MKKNFIILTLVITIMTGAFVYARSEQDEIKLLRTRIIKLQNRGRLGIRNLDICSFVNFYGSYNPVSRNVKSGEKFMVYYEPVNVSTKVEDGLYKKHLVQDLQVLSRSGKVLFERKKFRDLILTSRQPASEIYVTNEFNLKALPGIYIYKIILHDRIKGATTTKTMKITVYK